MTAVAPTRRPVGDLARRHPLAAFFVLAYALSWTFWTPYVLSEQGLGIWAFRFPVVLGSGQLLGLLPGAFAGPLGSALLLTYVTRGRAGLRTWAARLARWRIGVRWYAFAVLVLPAVQLAAGLAVPGAVDAVRVPSPLTLMVYLPALVVQVFTTGLSEEPGWRDFALPRSQDAYGPLAGTVLLGVLWGCWHLPLMLTEWPHPGDGPMAVLSFVGGSVLFSIVITWVFNSTGGSLPGAMLVHASSNNVISVLWHDVFPGLPDTAVPQATLVARAVLVVVLVVATRGTLGWSRPATTDRRHRPGGDRGSEGRQGP